jgi:hypothetical protein
MTLDDRAEALLVDGGIDGGNGIYFANAGEDVGAVGSLAPLIEGHVGRIVIRPDGSRCPTSEAVTYSGGSPMKPVVRSIRMKE